MLIKDKQTLDPQIIARVGGARRGCAKETEQITSAVCVAIFERKGEKMITFVCWRNPKRLKKRTYVVRFDSLSRAAKYLADHSHEDRIAAVRCTNKEMNIIRIKAVSYYYKT